MLYLHGWRRVLQFVCTNVQNCLFCRMANIIEFLSDGIYEEEGMDTEPPGDGIVDIPSSETEGGNLGDDEEKDSSILNSSSDSTLVQNVPSVGPSDRHTTESVPMDQTGAHTVASVSSTHVSVGRVSVAGVHTTGDSVEIPSLRCSVHTKSWQPGCAVCDQALLLSSKTTDIDPRMAVADRLLGRQSTKPTYAVELGLVGLEVARHVCHQPEPMTARQASQLMQTHLKLPPAQELELNSDLQAEAFFQDFEKQRAFQQQFEYKRKLLGLLKGIRASMTPLFALTDELEGFEAKLKLFCGELGITLAELDGDSGFQKGIGPDPHPIILKPIVAGPDISVPLVNPADMLGDLGLTPDMLVRVKERVNQVHQANSGAVDAVLGRLQDSFRHVYDLSAKMTFATSEHLNVFFRLSGFHDDALRRLVRHKLLTLFKPKVRKAVMKGAGQNKVGLFGGDEAVSNRIVESRKKDGIIRSAILTPATGKQKSKSKKKSSKTKTGTKGASSKKDGAAGKAGATKKTKKSKVAKVKAKKAKADSAAKTDGAGAAPQESGESSITAVLSSLHTESLKGDVISDIRRETSWPSSFPLKSAVEAVTNAGFKPEYISSALASPIGGRLSHAIDSYRNIKSDARIIQILKSGYQIPFKFRTPVQVRSQKTPQPATIAARTVLDEEVQGLISKNAVKVVQPVHGQYVSSYFAVPKSKRSPDKWRPILNLKRFNSSVRKISFRMEEVAWIRQWLRSGAWFCGIDIKDAFLHVPIHRKFRKFLRFEWGGKLLEWQVLPFGLTCSPRILTTMVRPIAGYLRDKFGILLSTFMDDMLTQAKSRKLARYETHVVCLVFMCCGWSLNWTKTILEPTQTPVHLGFLFDSTNKTIAIPEDKIQRLVTWTKSLLIDPVTTQANLESLVGTMVSVMPACPLAPLYYRALQRVLIKSLRSGRRESKKVSLSSTRQK